MNRLTSCALSFGLTIAFLSCSPEDESLQSLRLELPGTLYDYKVGVKNEVPTLGRVLFYDRQLSVNNSLSCASCHKQANGFADNQRFSVGFENRLTTRNSMPIQNLVNFFFPFPFDSINMVTDDRFGPVFSAGLFWDGRISNLNNMVLLPIANHVEMGVFDFDIIIDKMNSSPYYKELFVKAFGDDDITTERISTALATFLQSIRSDDTKLDRALRREVSLSPLEIFGQQLFNTTYECNSCHQVQDPSGYLMGGGFANIGLDENYKDIGLEGTTGNPWDNGRFKIPSLRNVALTAPYMHDGRFATLDSVMNHYSEGLKSSPNLDFRLRDQSGAPLTLKISEPEKRAIVAFLQTLTDYSMITDPKFSDPFKAN